MGNNYNIWPKPFRFIYYKSTKTGNWNGHYFIIVTFEIAYYVISYLVWDYALYLHVNFYTCKIVNRQCWSLKNAICLTHFPIMNDVSSFLNLYIAKGIFYVMQGQQACRESLIGVRSNTYITWWFPIYILFCVVDIIFFWVVIKTAYKVSPYLQFVSILLKH